MHKSRSLASGVSGVSATSSARMSTRKRPSSHFHPFIIIAVVISIGVLLAGLIMTVIAFWPGNSSIGYNPMRVAGPCVLSAGALMLIVTIIIAVYSYKNNAAYRKGRHGLYRNAMSRSYMSSRNTLNNPPLTPTYGRQPSNGYWGGEQPTMPLNYGYEQQQHSVYKIETMPDPNNRMSTSGVEVPAALRVKSPRSPSPLDTSRTSFDQAGRQSPMAGTPDIGNRRSGYSSESDTGDHAVDMYPGGPGSQPYSDGYGQQGGAYADYPDPLSYPSEAAQPKKKKKKKKPVAEGEEDLPLGEGEIDPVTGERKKKKKKKKKPVAENGEYVDESGQQLQRISIHAQPGTHVSITPGSAVESTF